MNAISLADFAEQLLVLNNVLVLAEIQHVQQQIKKILLKYVRLLRKHGGSFVLREFIGWKLIETLYQACVPWETIKSVLEAVFMIVPAVMMYEFAAAFNFCGMRCECTHSQTVLFMRYAFLQHAPVRRCSNEQISWFDVTAANSPTPLMLEMSRRDLELLDFPHPIVFIPKNVLVMKEGSIDYQNFAFCRPERCECEHCGILDNDCKLVSTTKDTMLAILKTEECSCLRNFATYLATSNWLNLLYADRKHIGKFYFNMQGHIRVDDNIVVRCFRNGVLYPFEAAFECFECENPVINVKYGTGCRLVLKRARFGYGVFAAHDIPKGAIVGQYCGDLVSNIRTEQRGLLQDCWRQSYFFDLGTNSSYSLDGLEYGDAGRWINHSKKPNMYPFSLMCQDISDNYITEIWFEAYTNISKGQELLIDYGYSKESAADYPWSQ